MKSGNNGELLACTIVLVIRGDDCALCELGAATTSWLEEPIEMTPEFSYCGQ